MAIEKLTCNMIVVLGKIVAPLKNIFSSTELTVLVHLLLFLSPMAFDDLETLYQ